MGWDHAVPGRMSFNSLVPSSVPSETHSSSRARDPGAEEQPIAERGHRAGLLSSVPGRMSLTSLVPSSVPSETHSSAPCSGSKPAEEEAIPHHDERTHRRPLAPRRRVDVLDKRGAAASACAQNASATPQPRRATLPGNSGEFVRVAGSLRPSVGSRSWRLAAFAMNAPRAGPAAFPPEHGLIYRGARSREQASRGNSIVSRGVRRLAPNEANSPARIRTSPSLPLSGSHGDPLVACLRRIAPVHELERYLPGRRCRAETLRVHRPRQSETGAESRRRGARRRSLARIGPPDLRRDRHELDNRCRRRAA